MIVEVSEPDYSLGRLDEYEQRHGIDSGTFYSHYQRGVNLISDEVEASLWAFAYEIVVRAQILSSSPDDGQVSPQYAA